MQVAHSPIVITLHSFELMSQVAYIEQEAVQVGNWLFPELQVSVHAVAVDPLQVG